MAESYKPSTRKKDYETRKWEEKVARRLEALSLESDGWSVSNLTTTKTYDADASSVAELADVLGTLIEHLKAIKVLKS